MAQFARRKGRRLRLPLLPLPTMLLLFQVTMSLPTATKEAKVPATGACCELLISSCGVAVGCIVLAATTLLCATFLYESHPALVRMRSSAIPTVEKALAQPAIPMVEKTVAEAATLAPKTNAAGVPKILHRGVPGNSATTICGVLFCQDSHATMACLLCSFGMHMEHLCLTIRSPPDGPPSCTAIQLMTMRLQYHEPHIAACLQRGAPAVRPSTSLGMIASVSIDPSGTIGARQFSTTGSTCSGMSPP